MRVSLIVLMLCLSPLAAQTVRLSDKDKSGNLIYQEKFVSVPAPSSAPVVREFVPYPNQVYWGNHLNPGGTIEVCNAVVDKAHRVGAWSKPAILNADDGWILYGGDWNQPPAYDSIGIVWKVKWTRLNPSASVGWPVLGKEMIFCASLEGSGPFYARVPLPWSGSRPGMKMLFNGDSFFSINSLIPGGAGLQADPPIVYASSLPFANARVEYCFVTHTGETQLSPPAIVTAPPATNVVATCHVTLGGPRPMGALGIHLYWNGKRLPAPQCTGNPQSADDWLWPLDCLSTTVSRYVSNAPSPKAAASPSSRLNQLQVAMKETSGNIIVDIDGAMNLYCPIVDEYAQWGGWPQKFMRKISSPSGVWRMNQVKSVPGDRSVPGVPNDHSLFWPGILVHNQKSIWEDLWLNMPYGSCGICFADYSGGQCFGNKFVDCRIECGGLDRNDTAPAVRNLTQGVRVSEWCSSSGHSASELVFRGCQFVAVVPIWMEHKQTANVWFYSTHASSFPPSHGTRSDRRASVCWINAPAIFNFREGLFSDCPENVIFSLGHSPTLHVDGLFVDQGCKSLISFTGYNTGSVYLSNSQINFWTQPGQRPSLAVVAGSSSPTTISMKQVEAKFNHGLTSVDVCCTSPNRMLLLFENSNLSESTVLREPSPENFMSLLVSLYGGYLSEAERESLNKTSEEGMKIVVPAYTLQTHVGAIAVPEKTVTMNSLTGRSKVKKVDWRSGASISPPIP